MPFQGTIKLTWNHDLRDCLKALRDNLAVGEYAFDRFYEPRFSEARERFAAYCRGMLEDVHSDFEVDVLVVPIIYGGWWPLFDEIKDTLLPLRACEGGKFATDQRQLVESVEKLITAKEPWAPDSQEKAARIKLGETYFAEADGQVPRPQLKRARTLASVENRENAETAGWEM